MPTADATLKQYHITEVYLSKIFYFLGMYIYLKVCLCSMCVQVDLDLQTIMGSLVGAEKQTLTSGRVSTLNC